MEFVKKHEDREEEMEEIPMETLGFDSIASARSRIGNTVGEGTSAMRKIVSSTRYRECLKNHAVNIGGHAVDGCGEFIAGGEEGTLDGLKCAACNCHRNFHRKETDADQRSLQQYHHYQQQYHQPQFSTLYRAPLQPSGYFHLASATKHLPLALPSPSSGGAFSRNDEDTLNPSCSGGAGSGLKKRYRSKFSQEQKEKMLDFSGRLG